MITLNYDCTIDYTSSLLDNSIVGIMDVEGTIRNIIPTTGIGSGYLTLIQILSHTFNESPFVYYKKNVKDRITLFEKSISKIDGKPSINEYMYYIYMPIILAHGIHSISYEDIKGLSLEGLDSLIFNTIIDNSLPLVSEDFYNSKEEDEYTINNDKHNEIISICEKIKNEIGLIPLENRDKVLKQLPDIIQTIIMYDVLIQTSNKLAIKNVVPFYKVYELFLEKNIYLSMYL